MDHAVQDNWVSLRQYRRRIQRMTIPAGPKDRRIGPSRIERGLFSLTKIVGLVVRPLILLFFLRNGDATLAHDFSLLLTATASSFVILNNQNYRVAYQYFLDDSRSSQSHGLGGRDIFKSYIIGTLIHIAFFIWIAAAVLWFWIGRADLFLIATVLIIIEKYFDDDQRVLVYKQRYYQWIANFTLRIILPSLALICAVLIANVTRADTYVAAAVVGMGAYILRYQKKFVRVSLKCLKNEMKRGMFSATRRYFITYKNEFFIAQVWAFLTANAIIVDRFFVNLTHPQIFSEYIFAVNVANTVQTFHNLGYVSFRRPALMKPGTSAIRAEFALMNWLLPLGLTLCILASHFGADALGFTLSRLDTSLILAISLLYLIHAVSLVAKEIAFWRLKREVLLAQECIVFIFPIVTYLLGVTDPLAIVLSTCVGVIARLGLLVWLTHLAQSPDSRIHLASSVQNGRRREAEL